MGHDVLKSPGMAVRRWVMTCKTVLGWRSNDGSCRVKESWNDGQTMGHVVLKSPGMTVGRWVMTC